MDSLPYLGLGLSSNLDASDRPQPYRLLDAHPGAFDFVEYSAPLSLEQAKAEASLFPTMWDRRAQTPALFHPVHLNLWGPELESPEALKALDAHARAVGSAWVGNDVGWWHSAGQPFPGYLYVSPPLDARGLDEAEKHVAHVQSHLSMPLVIENPAVISVRGDLHVLDFMAELHRRTGRPLLVDLGHLWSHQLSRGLDPTTGFDGFPWEKVIELHLAGGVVTTRGIRRFYVDDHTQPVREELFELLANVLPRCSRLRALTFEGDGHPEAIALKTLKRLRTLVPAKAEPLPLAADRRAPAPLDPPGPRPWELFSELHGATAPSEDPEGTRAELDFRLAVIAEALDLRFPLSRLLLAGTREQLVAFASSPEYRAVFEQGRTLEQAYASWSRKRAFETPGADAVVAFEAWLDGLARTPGPERTGRFPLDLSELLFATTALRRHLGQRSWAAEQLELSGLEALSQIALRAKPGPWAIGLKLGRRKWELVEPQTVLAPPGTVR